MTSVNCILNDVTKVEGIFYEVNVTVLGQNFKYYAFNFRGKLFFIEEKESRISKRVKNALKTSLLSHDYEHALFKLCNDREIKIEL